MHSILQDRHPPPPKKTYSSLETHMKMHRDRSVAKNRWSNAISHYMHRCGALQSLSNWYSLIRNHLEEIICRQAKITKATAIFSTKCKLEPKLHPMSSTPMHWSKQLCMGLHCKSQLKYCSAGSNWNSLFKICKRYESCDKIPTVPKCDWTVTRLLFFPFLMSLKLPDLLGRGQRLICFSSLLADVVNTMYQHMVEQTHSITGWASKDFMSQIEQALHHCLFSAQRSSAGTEWHLEHVSRPKFKVQVLSSKSLNALRSDD